MFSGQHLLETALTCLLLLQQINPHQWEKQNSKKHRLTDTVLRKWKFGNKTGHYFIQHWLLIYRKIVSAGRCRLRVQSNLRASMRCLVVTNFAFRISRWFEWLYYISWLTIDIQFLLVDKHLSLICISLQVVYMTPNLYRCIIERCSSKTITCKDISSLIYILIEFSQLIPTFMLFANSNSNVRFCFIASTLILTSVSTPALWEE